MKGLWDEYSVSVIAICYCCVSWIVLGLIESRDNNDFMLSHRRSFMANIGDLISF
jgi:hypothetical protein